MSATPAFKAAPVLSTVDGCLTSLPPAHFTKACHLLLPLSARPLRFLHLTCSSSSSSSSSLSREALSLSRKAPSVPLVARTSDWAQQDEFRVEEEVSDWEEEGQPHGKGEESVFSEWEEEAENRVGGITDWEEGEQAEAEGSVDGLEAGFSEWEEEEQEAAAMDAKAAVGAVAEGLEGEGEAAAEGKLYPEPPEEAKLFVGSLPYDMDSEKLTQLFDQAGVVEVAEVIYNRETDRSRGFGFVTMSTVEEAEKAMEMFHRHNLDGRTIRVNTAEERPTRYSF